METPPPTPPAEPRPSAPPRQPWPMKWIVAAIAAYVVLYTAINFGFRKPGPSHEPAAEAQERREHRLVHADMQGWVRLAAAIEAPREAAGAPRPAATTKSAAPAHLERELPGELVGLIPRAPALFPNLDDVAAPASVAAAGPFRVGLFLQRLRGAPAFGEPLAYARDRELFVILQDKSALAPGEQPRPPLGLQDLVLTAPAPLAAGAWSARLYTGEQVFAWSFTVE